jgi:hypothetical protein
MSLVFIKGALLSFLIHYFLQGSGKAGFASVWSTTVPDTAKREEHKDVLTCGQPFRRYQTSDDGYINRVATAKATREAFRRRCEEKFTAVSRLRILPTQEVAQTKQLCERESENAL